MWRRTAVGAEVGRSATDTMLVIVQTGTEAGSELREDSARLPGERCLARVYEGTRGAKNSTWGQRVDPDMDSALGLVNRAHRNNPILKEGFDQIKTFGAQGFLHATLTLRRS